MGYKEGTGPSSKPKAATLERSFAHHLLPHIQRWRYFLLGTVLVMFSKERVDFLLLLFMLIFMTLFQVSTLLIHTPTLGWFIKPTPGFPH